MPHRLDLSNWHRRHHFEFFLDYEQPFFSLCANVDVSLLHDWCLETGERSFFLASFYLALAAANEIEPFRYRLENRSVVVHDVVHGGCTILRRDETFGFAYFDFEPSYPRFEAGSRQILAEARAASGPLQPRPERQDMIHFSIIPWVHFSSFQHARRLGQPDSIPKIVFGRQAEDKGARQMPVSVEVHHALLDGLDVGRFYERLQSLLDDPAALTA